MIIESIDCDFCDSKSKSGVMVYRRNDTAICCDCMKVAVGYGQLEARIEELKEALNNLVVSKLDSETLDELIGGSRLMIDINHETAVSLIGLAANRPKGKGA